MGIQVQDVSKHFGSFQALDHVSVDIESGSLVALLGPSGSGKSTLLRSIAGLESPDSGRIFLTGEDATDRSVQDRNIGFVFQHYALFKHMTVRRNIAFGMQLRKMASTHVKARTEELLELVQLTGLGDRYPSQLSGGQRQRVAMGRAIVREPAAFLFDEPLSNLDAKLRVQMRLEIQKLHRELKTTSIFVTHDQVEAMTLAERMIVMNAGRAEQIGAPMEVYDNPSSMFVAGFIGSPAMNFLPGVVKAGSLDLAEGVRIALPLAIREKTKDGDAITLGVRPEHFAVTVSGMPFRVENAEALGADSLVHGYIAGSLCVVRVDGHSRHASGDLLNVTPAADKLYFFDSASGARIA